MVRKPDIQYVQQFYVHGSEARVIELKPRRRVIKTILPKVAPDKSIRIGVDPIALCGIVVAVVMMVMMLTAYAEYNACQDRNRQMQDYLSSLQLENAQLQQNFDSQIDLDYIEEVAGALGMVPSSDANQIQIEVQLPQEPTGELNLWQSITTFLSGLFA